VRARVRSIFALSLSLRLSARSACRKKRSEPRGDNAHTWRAIGRENRVVCRLRMSVRQWLLSQSNFEEAHAAMVKEAAQEQRRVASHAH
jgi:hypothetical protein